MQGAEQPPRKKSHPAGQKLQKWHFFFFLHFLRYFLFSEICSGSCPLGHSLELCLARYLSLHFFFFPNGLQDWLPPLALLLLAALLFCPDRWGLKEYMLGLETRCLLSGRRASSKWDEEEEVFTIPAALGRGSGQQSQQRYSPLCPATSWDPACWWSEWRHLFEIWGQPPCRGWGHPWRGHSQTGPSCTSVDRVNMQEARSRFLRDVILDRNCQSSEQNTCEPLVQVKKMAKKPKRFFGLFLEG